MASRQITITIPDFAGYKTLFINGASVALAVAALLFPGYVLPTPEQLGASYDELAAGLVLILGVVNTILRFMTSTPPALNPLGLTGGVKFESEAFADGYTAGVKNARASERERMDAYRREQAEREAIQRSLESMLGDGARAQNVLGAGMALPSFGYHNQTGVYHADSCAIWKAQSRENPRCTCPVPVLTVDEAEDDTPPLAAPPLAAPPLAAPPLAAPPLAAPPRDEKPTPGAIGRLTPDQEDKAGFADRVAEMLPKSVRTPLAAFLFCFLSPSALVLPVVGVAMLAGCAQVQELNAFAQAETTEQRAYAAYASFVALEETAARIVVNRAVPANVRRRIQQADRIAKPAADGIVTAIRAVQQARRSLQDGRGTVQAMDTATLALAASVRALDAPMTAFSRAVREGETSAGVPPTAVSTKDVFSDTPATGN